MQHRISPEKLAVFLLNTVFIIALPLRDLLSANHEANTHDSPLTTSFSTGKMAPHIERCVFS